MVHVSIVVLPRGARGADCASQKSAQKLGQELLKECRGEVDDVTLIIVGLHEGIS